MVDLEMLFPINLLLPLFLGDPWYVRGYDSNELI
jgi:hypothetical protein